MPLMSTFSRPGDLGVETGAELDQRRHPTFDIDRALGGLQNAAGELEQRGLARSVRSDQRHRLARLDVEIDPVEGDVLLRRRPAAAPPANRARRP